MEVGKIFDSFIFMLKFEHEGEALKKEYEAVARKLIIPVISLQ